MDLPLHKVDAVVRLLAEGNTVPFIARYRKEVTGSLDEIQIRAVKERRDYLSGLDARRQTIIASIEEQGKLDDGLRTRIEACPTKTALEDLYLPFRPRRRTKATMARDRGLEPLALRIMAQPGEGQPLAEAQSFVDPEKGVADAEAALAGARDICAEKVSEVAEVRSLVRERYLRGGTLVAAVLKGKQDEGQKFRDYFDYAEAVATIPSHRYLAVQRGESEGVLKLKIAIDDEPVLRRVLGLAGLRAASPFSGQLTAAVEDGYRRLIAPGVESDVRAGLKTRSDLAAVEVFAENLRNLLLAAPLGSKPVIGVDPGLRTGCKCASVSRSGDFVENMTFNLVQGRAALESAGREFTAFVKRHQPAAVAVGNGTGSREAEPFVRRCLQEAGIEGVIVVAVSEAGASVYSASPVAGEEFPDLDVTVRGAVSIARRLQDPLAELVKIEPQAIGVGQYQHDVNQTLLGRKLDEVVESCVNGVGVELSTASVPLLSRVAGIGPKTARNIVLFRQQEGAFRNRRQLLKVNGLGQRAFQQAAGFLRVRGGDHPLDASAVHPERYGLVQQIAGDMGVGIEELVSDPALPDRIPLDEYVSDDVGLPTLRDIVDELKKPGRDPREEFSAPAFREDVQDISDLEPGMVLEGVVTNVTSFGVFVDVGLHRDGLVHISQLADRYVRDPAEVVKAGERITVRVLEVDLPRGRISFSAKKYPAPDSRKA
jgi:uncharacterized protein